jgi:hypothetical protein
MENSANLSKYADSKSSVYLRVENKEVYQTVILELSSFNKVSLIPFFTPFYLGLYLQMSTLYSPQILQKTRTFGSKTFNSI